MLYQDAKVYGVYSGLVQAPFYEDDVRHPCERRLEPVRGAPFDQRPKAASGHEYVFLPIKERPLRAGFRSAAGFGVHKFSRAGLSTSVVYKKAAEIIGCGRAIPRRRTNRLSLNGRGRSPRLPSIAKF